MKPNFQNSKPFNAISKMPPGQHHQPFDQFAWPASEVVLWLINQPDVMQYIFTKAKASGAIIFDQESGTWHGRDYAKDDPNR